jgi:hypothetical protein
MAFATVNLISSLGSTATILTTDLFIKTISFTSCGILTLGKSIFTQNNGYIDLSSLEKMENKLDLLETIRIYDLWIKEILERESINIEKSVSLREAVNSFTIVLEELHEILKNIDEKVKLHKLKWFYSYRRLDFSNELEQIQIKKGVLDNRFNILQKIHEFT